MDAEERTKKAITLTRMILKSVLDDTADYALMFMTFYEVAPEEVENKIAHILEYLEKTTPEEESIE